MKMHKTMKSRTPRPLSPNKLASIRPVDAHNWLTETIWWSGREVPTWSTDAMNWLAREMPLKQALRYIAISHRVSPHELMRSILALKRKNKARRKQEAEEERQAIEEDRQERLRRKGDRRSR